MKLLFCITAMTKGGAERVMSIIANELVKENEVTIVCLANKEIEYKLDQRINIEFLDKKKRSKNLIIVNYNRYSKLKDYIHKNCPDIIISFLPVPSLLCSMVKNKTPLIICERNDPQKEFSSWLIRNLMKCLYPKANGFVFQTNEQMQYFSDKIQKKAVVIFNPLKDEFLEINREIKKENTIISVGRLVEQKNHKLLIEAFSDICKKYTEYKLKIYGEGPLREELQKRINDLNMADKILLCGVTNDIKTELNKAKIFVMSSNYEGMPNALNEAMAMGLAVISTNCPCGGPREVIQNGVNGLLIKVNDKKELTDKIEELITNDEKIQLMGEEAEKIKYKLCSDNIIKKWKEYINNIYDYCGEVPNGKNDKAYSKKINSMDK